MQGLNRSIGDKVNINPYSDVTGEIIDNKTYNKDLKFDYMVKLFIPFVDNDTVYTANYDSKNEIWWNYYNEDELVKLEENYALVKNQ